MANELDELMTRDPLELSAQDIDGIIAYMRKQRANYESGVKPKKDKGPKADLSAVIQALAPQAAPTVIKRRF